MQMKHEYDQNDIIHVHFGQQVPDYMKVFSFKAKGTFSTPKNYHRLVT